MSSAQPATQAMPSTTGTGRHRFRIAIAIAASDLYQICQTTRSEPAGQDTRPHSPAFIAPSVLMAGVPRGVALTLKYVARARQRGRAALRKRPLPRLWTRSLTL